MDISIRSESFLPVTDIHNQNLQHLVWKLRFSAALSRTNFPWFISQPSNETSDIFPETTYVELSERPWVPLCVYPSLLCPVQSLTVHIHIYIYLLQHIYEVVTDAMDPYCVPVCFTLFFTRLILLICWLLCCSFFKNSNVFSVHTHVTKAYPQLQGPFRYVCKVRYCDK